MEIIRTPDEHFQDLPGFPWTARYRTWEGLRLAHIDEGPPEAPVALLIHGEPTWSYLYRKMIPGLLAAGYRVVAPDHPGFGRSDKPVGDDWYTIERHIAALRHLIETLKLTRITLFVQDWGGPIGLRQALTMPERFVRIVILNTWLHHEGYEYSAAIRRWREASQDPRHLGGDMPVGRIVSASLRREGQNKEAVSQAYAAPFTDAASKGGARRFPFCLPFAQPELGQAAQQSADFAALPTLNVAKHVIFGDADDIFTADWGRLWAERLGASFDTISGAGHFLQEEAGDEIVATFLTRRGPEQ